MTLGAEPVALARIRSSAERAGRLLLVSDYDGTLSPIVPGPDDAVLLPQAGPALERLAVIGRERPDRLVLAIVSGRPAADVAGRVGVAGIRYRGNYGLDATDGPGGDVRVSGDGIDSDAAQNAAERLAEAVSQEMGAPAWLTIEPKGPAVSFHLRRAADPVAARASLLDVARRAIPDGVLEPDPAAGVMVLEFRPPAAGHKGDAVAQLIAETDPSTVIVIGDDAGDVDAFRAVATWRAAALSRDGLIVGVDRRPETPPEVLALADVVVAGPPAVAALLAALATAL